MQSMGVFVSSAEGLAESPKNCLALAQHLMGEYPLEADAVRAAYSKRYLPPHQYVQLLAHTVNGLLEMLFGEEVDRHAQQRGIPHRTSTHISEIFGESPEDYALRKSQEVLAQIPDAEWERLAEHVGCSIGAYRHAVWATCFYGFAEERLP